MKLSVKNSEIELVLGDITESDTEAIVNAANHHLQLGAGVAGAIDRKGGPIIQKECNAIGGGPVGSAAITSGGNLNAKYVIHAVGPRMGEGDEELKLENATISSLKVADENDIATITFPAISTGVFGFPIDACAKIMLGAAHNYLQGSTGIQKIVFALFDEASCKVFQKEFEKGLIE
jgi:O-acetyl-ADP-ribose deacetylase (regulator of RNase III)